VDAQVNLLIRFAERQTRYRVDFLASGGLKMGQTYTLKNAVMKVELSAQKNGAIHEMGLVRSGLNHVGGVPFQGWLKFGEAVDPLGQMLHLFQVDMFGKEATVTSADSHAVEMEITTHGVTSYKRYELSKTEPMLGVTFGVKNGSDKTEKFQFEAFHNWGFGPLCKRKAVATHWIDLTGRSPSVKVHATPYGQMHGSLASAKGAMLALCDMDWKETVLVIPDGNWLRFSSLFQMGDNWRSPYTDEVMLEPGKSFSFTYWLYILDGVAGVDSVSEDWLLGLTTDDQVYGAGQAIRVAAARAEMAPELKKVLGLAKSCCGSPVPLTDETAVRLGLGEGLSLIGPLKHGTPGTGSTFEAGVGAGSVPAGETTLTGEFHHRIDKTPFAMSTSRVRVLDQAGSGWANISAAKSPFKVRGAHLIFSQQSAAGVTKEQVAWVMENLLAANGYNTLILEFNKGLKFKSHPELAEDWSLTHEDAKWLVAKGRQMGLEMIPQQNLYGHQYETNLTKVYPELREVKGELQAYCPTHPKVRAIVADQVGELMDIFEPRYFHQGHDEVQFHGRKQPFVGVCERCKAFGRPHEVFAHDVNEIHAVVKRKSPSCRSVMWGDMITPMEYSSLNYNGKEGEIYKAVDLLPKDLVITDWHYYDTEDLRSVEYFVKRGWEVWGGTWFHPRSMGAFTRHCRDHGATGVVWTTWCRPDPTSLPLEAAFMQAILAADPERAVDAGLQEEVRMRAYGLWYEWVKVFKRG
jgi:hypothetical protein